MKAYRAAILRFDDQGSAVYEADGLLVTGPDAGGTQVERAVGDFNALRARSVKLKGMNELPWPAFWNASLDK